MEKNASVHLYRIEEQATKISLPGPNWICDDTLPVRNAKSGRKRE